MKYVLYHAQCYDGFGSAFSAWKKFGDTAKYIAVSYGSPIPDLSRATEIYILDFSYDEATLKGFADKAKVVLLDHHKTAEEKLGRLTMDLYPNLHIVFDMSKSGALLSWEYFHPNTEVPQLIAHISDRDLWQFKLEGTKEIHKGLVAKPMDFKVWDTLDLEQLKIEGTITDKLYSQIVNETCSKAWLTKIDGHEVPCVNTSMAWSEVGAKLLELYPKASFAASFTVMNNSTMWSLRSRPEFDVSEVAKKFGGGGHKNAAGFKTARY